MAAAKAAKSPPAPADPRRLSQTNRGLRMILVAGVMIVALSWLGTVGGQYVRLLQVEALVAADQDALRVMCAVEPPSERNFGWLHICEAVAGVDRRDAAIAR